jgi:hypothetical protein
MVWPVKAGYVPVARDGRGGTIFHCICINPEGEGATVDQELDVLRPVGDGVKRLDANMKGMVMITTPSVSSIQTLDLGNNHTATKYSGFSLRQDGFTACTTACTTKA